MGSLEVANSNALPVRLFISPIDDDQSIARDCFHPASIRKGIPNAPNARLEKLEREGIQFLAPPNLADMESLMYSCV